MSNSPPRVLRFGVFDVDLSARALRKNGLKVRLQEQPYRLLIHLLERPGEVVTREELREKLWPEDEYGEFDLNLNTTVKKLRQALADSADSPRWIETIPKVGYKFLAPVEYPATNVARGGNAATSAQRSEAASPDKLRRLPWAVAAGLAIALAVVSVVHFAEPRAERPVKRWSFSPSSLLHDSMPASPAGVAVSPNGRHIAYVAEDGERTLWVRDVDRLEPRELPGTEGASKPFWSPDSRFIGFDDGKEIKKIAVQQGPPIAISSSPGMFFGASWSPDGESIAFSAILDRGSRVFEVPAQGGEPKLLFDRVETSKGSFNSDPHFLPSEAGGRILLLRVGDFGIGDIVLQNLETGESITLTEGDLAVYSSSGHIVHVRQGDLWALPFSLDNLRPSGEAFPIVENSGFPSVANDGTLVFLRSPDTGLDQLVWRNRAGETLGVIGQPQFDIQFLALAPDDRSVAVKSTESGNHDIWVHEVERPLKRRWTIDESADVRPQWSPSGREITFQSGRSGNLDIYRRAADGTGDAELLVSTEGIDRPYNWSSDGNYLLFTIRREDSDLWYLKRKGDGEGFESHEFLATPFSETSPHLSPTGRFVAYSSNQSGEFQVYVREFPSGEGQTQLSTNGGSHPRWSRDGQELFYVEDDTLMAVRVKATPVFSTGVPIPLFADSNLRTGGDPPYDVSDDGRFVMVSSAEKTEEEPPAIHVVENWYEEFRNRE